MNAFRVALKTAIGRCGSNAYSGITLKCLSHANIRTIKGIFVFRYVNAMASNERASNQGDNLSCPVRSMTVRTLYIESGWLKCHSNKTDVIGIRAVLLI